MTDPDARTVTKRELVNRIADRLGLTKVTVRDVTQQFLGEIIHELSEGNRLEFRDFGVFEVRERAARIAQNPRTLEKVEVPAKRVVKFKVGRVMRERVCDEIDADDLDEDVESTEAEGSGGSARRSGAGGASGSGEASNGSSTKGASSTRGAAAGASGEGARANGEDAPSDRDAGSDANGENGRGAKPQPPSPPPSRPGSPF